MVAPSSGGGSADGGGGATSGDGANGGGASSRSQDFDGCALGVTSEHPTDTGYRVAIEQWVPGYVLTWHFSRPVAVLKVWGKVHAVGLEGSAVSFALREAPPPVLGAAAASEATRRDQWGFSLATPYRDLVRITCYDPEESAAAVAASASTVTAAPSTDVAAAQLMTPQPSHASVHGGVAAVPSPPPPPSRPPPPPPGRLSAEPPCELGASYLTQVDSRGVTTALVTLRHWRPGAAIFLQYDPSPPCAKGECPRGERQHIHDVQRVRKATFISTENQVGAWRPRTDQMFAQGRSSA